MANLKLTQYLVRLKLDDVEKPAKRKTMRELREEYKKAKAAKKKNKKL